MKTSFDCACGRRHQSDTAVIIKNGAVAALYGLLSERAYRKVLFVSDVNTEKIAGKEIKTALKAHRIAADAHIFISDDLVADEQSLGGLLIRFDPATDMLIGLGSGTINDICRFFAYKTGKPYIIVATAPSMDGYCSGVSPLVVDGLKTTYEAKPPAAVICDIDILKTAPPAMICAGLGDILGKLTCLCDWRLGHLLTGEYYCDRIAGMMQTAVGQCFKTYGDGENIDKKSPEHLIEALCLSGTAMAYAGNSRPASGAEHHIAHFWEMYLLAAGRPQILHGIKVAFTTLIVIAIYQKLLQEPIDWAQCARRAADFSLDDYAAKVQHAYQDPRAAKNIVESAFFIQNNTPENIRQRIAQYQENWSAIKTVIRECLPDGAFCARFLRNAGLPDSPRRLGIGRETFVQSILYAKELRDRFTVLQIASDLGILEKYAEQIAGAYYGDRF